MEGIKKTLLCILLGLFPTSVLLYLVYLHPAALAMGITVSLLLLWSWLLGDFIFFLVKEHKARP